MSRYRQKISRRDLIKQFGMAAFLIHPVLRSMAMAQEVGINTHPRFLMFFKGASYLPKQVNPASLSNLTGTAIAPMAPHASDIILFKGMNIHGGSPKVQGGVHSEEHAAGMIGSSTGNYIRYYSTDAYYAYGDHESVDIRIARHYQSLPDLQGLPFSSLHIGAGVHSDADSSGPGQRYISFRNRQTGDGRYDNAIAPEQNAGKVYDMLMQRIQLICSGQSNQPSADQTRMLAVLNRKKSLLDFKMNDVLDAKRTLGLDSEHSRQLDGLLDGWRETERLINSQIAALQSSTPPVSGGGTACPTITRPTGDGTNKKDNDEISPVHDQMIALIKLAFEWDLTRVISFSLAAASGGQTWRSRGLTDIHHRLEHNNNEAGLMTMGNYYSTKFAATLSALKSINDGDGKTGLNNSMVMLGMECWSTGSLKHYLTDIPFIFAGQGGGRFQTGRIINAGGRNNNDLLVSCLNGAGIATNSFGISNLNRGPII